MGVSERRTKGWAVCEPLARRGLTEPNCQNRKMVSPRKRFCIPDAQEPIYQTYAECTSTYVLLSMLILLSAKLTDFGELSSHSSYAKDSSSAALSLEILSCDNILSRSRRSPGDILPPSERQVLYSSRYSFSASDN